MTDLSDKMRAWIGSSEVTSDLKDKADAFDRATEGFYSDPQTVSVKSFMGAYARARMLWCRVTGEALI